MKLVIGVMGTADGPLDDDVRRRGRELGRVIGARGCTLITGACPGISYEAVLGAREAGGLVVGVSPALGREEHEVRYRSPVDGFDVVIYTGSGLMGREVATIRSSDIVVIAGGRSGTLGEFAIAYDEGRLIGVMTGTGGIADAIEPLVPLCTKGTGAVVLFGDDPEALVDDLLDYYRTEHHKHPSIFAREYAGNGPAVVGGRAILIRP